MTQNGWEDKGTNRNSYSWRGLELGSQEAEPERGIPVEGISLGECSQEKELTQLT